MSEIYKYGNDGMKSGPNNHGSVLETNGPTSHVTMLAHVFKKITKITSKQNTGVTRMYNITKITERET